MIRNRVSGVRYSFLGEVVPLVSFTTIDLLRADLRVDTV